MKIDKHDPKWTAYILGELDEKQTQELNQIVEQDPEAAEFVKELKNTIAFLEQDLTEPANEHLSFSQYADLRDHFEESKKESRWSMWMASLRRPAFSIPAVTALLLGLVSISLYEDSLRRLWPLQDQAPQGMTSQNFSAPKQLTTQEASPAPREQRQARQKKKQTIAANSRQMVTAQKKAVRAPSPSQQGLMADFSAAQPPRLGGGMVHESPHNTESYDHIEENGFKTALQNPLSTFSIDVDTASYSNVRRFLNQGSQPPVDAVRIEELVNYFNYDYPAPKSGPFKVNVEVSEAPWNKKNHLVRIGLKGKPIAMKDRPASNLVFLLDVSGSMAQPNKLPLLKKSLRLLIDQLGENDRISIVVYAGASGLVLPPTPANERAKIMGALEQLRAGGSTNGGAGIELAYNTATSQFIEGGINRVILATDGDFNVGTTSQGDLVRLIQEKAKSGVFLTVLGFGMGNLKDSTMEKLANKGNGSYAYIDSEKEAKKVFIEQVSGTLMTIAKDVKIQVEFNPQHVASYRLIGYENRLLKNEDFANDKKDAGEIGAGHTVTALYEIEPTSEEDQGKADGSLKYQEARKAKEKFSDELLTVKLRYKHPEGSKSQLMSVPVKNKIQAFSDSTEDFKFQAAVAGFGMLLRDSEHKGDMTWRDIKTWCEQGVRKDKSGFRSEFLELIQKAEKLSQ